MFGVPLSRRVCLPLLLLTGIAAGCGGIPDAPAHDASITRDTRRAESPDAGHGADQVRAPDSGPALDSEPGVDGGEGIDGEIILDGGADIVPLSPPATIVVLPDTQYYAAYHPSVFTDQTQWIVEQRSLLNIAAVLHVGDVVDAPHSVAQWEAANTSMRLLDGLVPYVLVPGNHDIDDNRRGLMNQYFSPTSMPWITGTMTAGQIENNYALLNIGSQPWIVVGLEFSPRDAVVLWADALLKSHPGRLAILVTHAYLYSDGNRYDINISKVEHQDFIPQDYRYTPNEGINDGEMLWQKLVAPNPNVRLVFSGHQTGGARLTSTRPSGSLVHQMLSDYQWLEGQDFGFGYLRTLELDYNKKTIQVRTYSPYLHQYLTDDANQFALDWNL